MAPLSAANEASVLTHVINRCEELLDEFPTSLAEDQRLIRDLQGSVPGWGWSRRDVRAELALAYRIEVRRRPRHLCWVVCR